MLVQKKDGTWRLCIVLATEVTPGLLAGAEPDTHQFLCHGLFIDGVTEWKPTQNDIIPTLN